MSQAPQKKVGTGDHKQLYLLKFLPNCKRNSQLAAFKIPLCWSDGMKYQTWIREEVEKEYIEKKERAKKTPKENSCPGQFYILQALTLEITYHGSICPGSQTWKGAHSFIPNSSSAMDQSWPCALWALFLFHWCFHFTTHIMQTAKDLQHIKALGGYFLLWESLYCKDFETHYKGEKKKRRK